MEQNAKDFRQSLTKIGELAAHPAAFGVLLIYAVLWFIFDRTTLDWHGFATLAAVFMTLIIQRAEDRDTQALQAKLDELLRASRSVDSELAKIDSLEPEDIKRIRNESRKRTLTEADAPFLMTISSYRQRRHRNSLLIRADQNKDRKHSCQHKAYG